MSQSTSTIGDIANWISDTTLKRTDMYDVAVDAVWNFYSLLCGRVPFDELQRTSGERALDTTIETHDIGDLPMVGINSIRITYPEGMCRRLRKTSLRIFENYTYSTSAGNRRPYLYDRWANSLQFNCIPDTGQTIRIRYWYDPEPEADIASTQILTPRRWDQLLRYEGLWRVYTTLEKHQEAMLLVQPSPIPAQASPRKTWMTEFGIIPRLWNDLLKTTSFSEAIDADFGINPIQRDYTALRS